MFFIGNAKVILRDLIEEDIAKRIDWEKVDIEWQDWDAPWENENVTLEEQDAWIKEKYIPDLEISIEKLAGLSHEDVRSEFQIVTNDDDRRYIGWVNSYRIDDNYDYEGECKYTAIGIDIPDMSKRRSGYGEAALALFIRYLRKNGHCDIFTQTWSGNYRMIALAEKLGFVECKRNVGSRSVNGKFYDALTFKLNKEAFDSKYDGTGMPRKLDDDVAYDYREIEPERKLDELRIEYVRLTHSPAATMELCEGIGSEYGASHCKNLFLTNRQGTRFFLALIDGQTSFRTSDVSKMLGVSRLSFGSAEQLKNILGLQPGSVSILGLVNECAMKAYNAGKLRIAIDKGLLKKKKICVHPNINTATLVIDSNDILVFLTKMRYEYMFIEI